METRPKTSSSDTLKWAARIRSAALNGLGFQARRRFEFVEPLCGLAFESPSAPCASVGRKSARCEHLLLEPDAICRLQYTSATYRRRWTSWLHVKPAAMTTTKPFRSR